MLKVFKRMAKAKLSSVVKELSLIWGEYILKKHRD
jgi:hypothetical protein